MQGMMKKMGIAQDEIISERVIIEKKDGKKIIIEDQSVIRISMQGQISFQISGNVNETEEKLEISKEDIETVMEKTGCSKEKAKKTLENDRKI